MKEALYEILMRYLTRVGFVLWGGGGGGQAQQAQPTQSTVTNTNLPDYAQPAMTQLIGQTQALTDTNQNPYQPYSGQRVAGFDPLQQQAFSQIGGMQPSAANGQAAAGAQGIAGLATNLQGYNPAQFDPNQVQGQNVTAQQTSTQRFTDPGVAASYMDPYMKNVVDFQESEAARQSAIQGLGIDANAAGMGAFGGSRQGLMQSQRMRDLGTLQGGIAATGASNAYNTGAQNFQTDQARALQSQTANQGASLQAGLANQQVGMQGQLANQQAGMTAQQLAEQSRQFGANLGLQGLQTGLQANQLLGNMGQQDYSQSMGINAAQQQAGATQQQNAQQNLNNQYQDYATQQNYPYKQLGFMSDILHGASGTQSASSMYQAPPTTTSSLASLGLGAYGISNLLGSGKKAGGVVKLAAGGALPDQYIQKSLHPGATAMNPIDAMRVAQARGMERTAAAPMQRQQEVNPFQARMDQGIAELGADPTMGMAEGGILGFAAGDVIDTDAMDAVGGLRSQVYPSKLRQWLSGPSALGAYEAQRGELQNRARRVLPEGAPILARDTRVPYSTTSAEIAALPPLQEPPAINQETGQEYTPVSAPAAQLPAPAPSGIAKLRPAAATGTPGTGGAAYMGTEGASPQVVAEATNGEGAMGIDAILEKSLGVEKKLRENDPTGDELEALRDEIHARTAKRAAGSDRDLGLMALTAAKEFAQPGRSFVTAAGDAAGAVGEKALTLGQAREAADRLDQDAEMKLAQAQIMDRKGDKETARKMVADAMRSKEEAQRHRDQVRIAEAQTNAVLGQTQAQRDIAAGHDASAQKIAGMRLAALGAQEEKALNNAMNIASKALEAESKNMSSGTPESRKLAAATRNDPNKLRAYAMTMLGREGGGIAAARSTQSMGLPAGAVVED